MYHEQKKFKSNTGTHQEEKQKALNGHHMIAKNFPVICVGGLAGGLDASIRLLKHLTIDMGVAIVIVNHLRTVATMLHEILPH